METRGSGSLRPGQRSTRRITFLTLVLLAVAAPAGFVLAGERSSPYIVLFDENAVSTTVTEQATSPLRATAPDASSVAKTRREVDPSRVRKHVTEIQARSRIKVTNVYTKAVGGFSTELTGAQVRTLRRDPAVAAIVADEEIHLDEGAAGFGAGGIRTTANPRASIPAGIRRVGAQRNTLARVDGRDTRVGADVAIIDTGIERNHPDLNVAGGYNCTSRNREK